MALQAVGFDIDGTLYPDHRAFGRSIPFFLANYRSVMAFSRTRKAMRTMAGSPEMMGEPLEVEVKIFAQELGCSVDEARNIRDHRIYRDWEKCFQGLKIYPNVRESLIKLRESGLKLAALSDFPVGNKLKYFGLDDLFDCTLGFPESGGLKPDAKPFERMAECLSLEPSVILYVGNKLEYDVHGAEAAGMRGSLIGPPGRKAPSGTTVFRNYRHLAESILTEVTQ